MCVCLCICCSSPHPFLWSHCPAVMWSVCGEATPPNLASCLPSVVLLAAGGPYISLCESLSSDHITAVRCSNTLMDRQNCCYLVFNWGLEACFLPVCTGVEGSILWVNETKLLPHLLWNDSRQVGRWLTTEFHCVQTLLDSNSVDANSHHFVFNWISKQHVSINEKLKRHTQC